ncbi:craniofacial development protein 2, partial [Aplysia californica]|uniref:Craniofacial development protein 2 n=1 Tax=Aplysia californica TaxID=6500 RepID=A0ABM1A6V5_APLCA
MDHITSINKDKDVKGSSERTASSGRVSHAQQVTPDRHQDTAHKRKNQTRNTATWNVRTLLEKGKLDNIKKEMKRMNVNIMGLCEVRWTGAGRILSDSNNIIYSRGDKHERGVAVILDMPTSKTLKGYLTISDRVMLVRLKGSPFDTTIIQAYAPTSESTEDEIEKFYDEINQAKTHCKSQDIVIVMGDFNAKVGAIRHEDIVGPYGLGNRNERGEKLIEWAILNDMIIGNTWYEQPPRRLWTWKSPGDSARNQIDYIMIKKRYKNGMLNVKTRPGADCYSDHVPVVGKFRIRLKKTHMSKKKNMKLNMALLQSNKEIQDKFRKTVQNKFCPLEEIQDIEQQWEQLKTTINEAAKD